MTRTSNDTGATGAYSVCAELSRRGWPASPTYGNTSRTDVLAQVGPERLPVAIQVKTKSAGSRDFQPGSVNEYSARGANEWVVLVALRDEVVNDYYIVPRDHVCATVKAFHRDITSPRVILGEQEFENYKDKWGFLEQPSWEVESDLMADWVKIVLPSLDWPGDGGV